MLCLLFCLELRLEDDRPYLVGVHGCDQPYAITHISLVYLLMQSMLHVRLDR
jgi:hypothetical protein